MRYDLFNPTPASRIIYDGIGKEMPSPDGSKPTISGGSQIEVPPATRDGPSGTVTRGSILDVELADHVAQRLQAKSGKPDCLEIRPHGKIALSQPTPDVSNKNAAYLAKATSGTPKRRREPA